MVIWGGEEGGCLRFVSHRLYKDDLKAFFTPLAAFYVVNSRLG